MLNPPAPAMTNGSTAAGEQVEMARGVDLLFVDDATYVHDADTRTLHGLPPEQVGALLAVLGRMARPVPPDQAARVVVEVTGASPAEATHQVDAFRRAGLLVDGDRDPDLALVEWKRFGWTDAHRFHRHLRLLPMIDWATAASASLDRRLMAEYLEAEPPPPLCSERPDRRARRQLPAFDEVDIGAVTALRDTLMARASEPLTAGALTTLLALALGRSGSRVLPVTGTHITKTSPSGGSRHPLEGYVLVTRPIDGIAPGTYHFNVGAHSLDLLDDANPSRVVRDDLVILRDRPGFDPAATVVLAAEVERSMFRYRESRSYRVLHHDAGHLLQTIAHLASGLGRPSYRGYTVREPALVKHLGLSPLRQIPLGFAVIG
jgi:SagB-type dehydrogenase family enzyme